MFPQLFAESGLSLDRLKSLLEVGAAGSIVKAAGGDPVRQSQYSRQIKELEDFFRTRLIERQGKGTRLTAGGGELARISRFFLLGLSNFQRGCLAAEQTFQLGAPSTFNHHFLLPTLARLAPPKRGVSYAVETVADEEIERRLHDLTLDFGIVTRSALSRPLQTRLLGPWSLALWLPSRPRPNPARVTQALHHRTLPLVLPRKELAALAIPWIQDYPAALTCDSFLEALTALGEAPAPTILPDFLVPDRAGAMVRVAVPALEALQFSWHLAWNPRLLRLNPHAARHRDQLALALTRRCSQQQ